MIKTVLAASLALALTVNMVGHAAHAQVTSSLNTLTVSETHVPQPPVRVNTTTAGDQYVLATNALSDGGYLIVWYNTPPNPSIGLGSYLLQRFDSEGKRVGSETSLQTTVRDGFIEVLTNGDIVLAYQGARDAQGNVITGSGAVSGAFFQKFNASGTQNMRETAIATTFGTSTVYGSVMVEPLVDGGFVVTWTSQYDFSGTVRKIFSVQSHDASGQRVGSPVVLSADNFPLLSLPIDYGIQAHPDGGYMLYKSRIDTSGSGCTYGAMTAPVTKLAYYYDKNLVSKPIISPIRCGGAIPLKGDRYLTRGDNATGPYYQFMDGNGQLIGLEKPIAARTELKNANLVDIVDTRQLIDGSFLLLWRPGASYMGQKYTREFDPIGEAFTIAERPRQILPLAGGSVILTWSALKATGTDFQDVYSQRLQKPEAGGCIKPAAWVMGQQYGAGARVFYAPSGLTYAAKFDNPGYNPTVSTFFWAPIASCTKPAAWVTNQQYPADAFVSYSNGLSYVAKFANPGYNPTISTFFWTPVASCIKPAAWVIGQQYAADALVSYTPNGLTYAAKFDNPGYNPTISTFFWAPVAC